ncbi:MAG: YccF domain-containing protein [Bacillota bacterium]|nr:YccF domain-containing protein [Bacillota bacterium]
MRFIGNILWMLLCGFFLALLWLFFGLLWCLTIIGIPVGLQCFKFASLSLWPFGRDVQFSNAAFSFLVNLLWLLFGGLEIALTASLFGLVFCVTIVGIPFGRQCFKIAKLALLPFGASIVRA